MMVANGKLKSLSQYFHPQDILSLIAGLWNPRRVAPEVVTTRLLFEIEGRARKIEKTHTRQLFAQLFLRSIVRYVEGTGHPEHSLVTDPGILSAVDIAHERGNKYTRPSLMAACFTGSRLYICEDEFIRFKVRVINIYHGVSSKEYRSSCFRMPLYIRKK